MPERILGDRELKLTDITVTQLRAMRTAAFPSHGFLSRFQRTSPLPVQEIATDARNLSTTAGSYLALRASGLETGIREREELEHVIADVKTKYREYRPGSFTGTKSMDPAESIIDKLKTLSIDPDHALRWELVESADFDVDSVADFLDREIGLVSPLSGDYLRGSIYRSFLFYTQDRTFPYQMAIASIDLRSVVLEAGNLGRSFEELTEIGIYLDISASGSTGEAVYRAVSLAYPDKTVFEPPIYKGTLPPSDKMVQRRLEENSRTNL